MKERRSARVILTNTSRQVLLIRFAVERQNEPFVFWATPGGSVERDESDLDAARRELKEELGLDIELTGPVHCVVSEFDHEGERVSNTDVFFAGHAEQLEVMLRYATEAERLAMKEIRWWSMTELERTAETIFPVDLTKVLGRLGCSE